MEFALPRNKARTVCFGGAIACTEIYKRERVECELGSCRRFAAIAVERSIYGGK